MEKLFTYGSLQYPEIQQKLFGRLLEGSSDTLVGHEKAKLNVDGKTFNVANQKEGSSIDGFVYELSDKELERADRYEGKAYKRIKTKLKSGEEAWLYLRV